MKILENSIEAYYYLRVVLSPLIFGAIIAFIVYNTVEAPFNEILAIVIILSALYAGIKWANWARKKHGSSNFIAKVDASPDLDEIRK